MNTQQYKNLKGLKKENLRDNMTDLELVLNMLAEATSFSSLIVNMIEDAGNKDETPE